MEGFFLQRSNTRFEILSTRHIGSRPCLPFLTEILVISYEISCKYRVSVTIFSSKVVFL